MGMDRNRERLTGLLLFHCEHTVLDVLAAHLHHIAAPLPRVQQQRQRQPGLRADMMVPASPRRARREFYDPGRCRLSSGRIPASSRP
jgi:hypothetical protein